MITVRDIKEAIDFMLAGYKYTHIPLKQQLVNSLHVYEDRGEFDGSIKSAIDCLTQAGYEVIL